MASFTQLLFEQHKLQNDFKNFVQNKSSSQCRALLRQMEHTQKLAIDLQIQQLQTVVDYDANANVALNQIKSDLREVTQLRTRVRQLQHVIVEYEDEKRVNQIRKLIAETDGESLKP